MTEPDFLRATRASYDAIAAEYAEHAADGLAAIPWDRAVLAAFADIQRKTGAGPVAEVGCGPGRIAAHLHALGLDVFGVDLSPEMVEVARRTYPDLRFDEGSMLALDLPNGALGGIVAWYSTIHIPAEQLPAAFAEFHRVLAPGGHALLAFQVGDETVRHTERFGHPISLTFYRRRPDQVAELLVEAGFTVRANLVREPDVYPCGPEKTPQAYLLARR